MIMADHLEMWHSAWFRLIELSQEDLAYSESFVSYLHFLSLNHSWFPLQTVFLFREPFKNILADFVR